VRRRALLLTVLAMLGLLVRAPAVQAGPPTSPLSGHWEATDPLDGSDLDAFISGGSHPQILYTDDEATGACGELSDQAFTSFLTGTVDGDDLNSTMRWARCGTVHLFFAGLAISWTIDDQGDADPSNDVLSNSFEEIYTRA
jgi:hypothetical protein